MLVSLASEAILARERMAAASHQVRIRRYAATVGVAVVHPRVTTIDRVAAMIAAPIARIIRTRQAAETDMRRHIVSPEVICVAD